MRYNNKARYPGCFKTLEEAILARDAALKVFDENLPSVVGSDNIDSIVEQAKEAAYEAVYETVARKKKVVGNGPDQLYLNQMASLVDDDSCVCTAADIRQTWSRTWSGRGKQGTRRSSQAWRVFIMKNSLNITQPTASQFLRMQDAVLRRFGARSNEAVARKKKVAPKKKTTKKKWSKK